MRRTTSILFVLVLFCVTATSAFAHDQKLTDGQNDAWDYSDQEPSANTSTPLDLKSALFSETSRRFVITLRMHQAVTPDELCDGSCAMTDNQNEGVMFVDLFKGSLDDPKSYYFIVIASTADGQYAAGLYNSQGNLVEGGLIGTILDDGQGFLFKVTRGKLRGYPKGAKLKWLVSSAYASDADGSDCVPNTSSPYYGHCWDYLPNNAPATHTLRK